MFSGFLIGGLGGLFTMTACWLDARADRRREREDAARFDRMWPGLRARGEAKHHCPPPGCSLCRSSSAAVIGSSASGPSPVILRTSACETGQLVRMLLTAAGPA